MTQLTDDAHPPDGEHAVLVLLNPVQDRVGFMKIDHHFRPIALLYPPFRLGQGIHDLKRFYNDYPTKHAPEKFRFIGASPVPVRTFDVEEETDLGTNHTVLGYYDRQQFVIHFDRFSPVATGYLGVPRP